MGIRNKAFLSYLLVDISLESMFRCVQLYVTWWFIQVYNMPFYLSIILSIVFLVSLIFIPISGVWSDKIRLTHYILHTVYLGGLMLFLLTIGIKILANTKYWTFALTLPLVFLSIITALLRPLSMKVINNLFKKEESIKKAYKAKYSLIILNILLGPTLSGFLIATYGGIPPLILAYIFFFLAFLGATAFKYTNPTHLQTNFKNRSITMSGWLNEIIHGFKLSFSIKEERIIAITSSLINFFFVPFIFLLLPDMVIHIYQYSMWEVGIIELFFGVGIAIACIDYSIFLIKNRLNSYYTCLLYAFIFVSSLFFFALFSNMLLLCLAGVVMGVSLNSFNVMVNTRRARSIPSSHQAIMEGCFVFLYSAAIPLGFIFTGTLMSLFPSQLILFTYALTCFLSFFFLYTSSNIKTMFQTNIEANYYLKKYPHLFN